MVIKHTSHGTFFSVLYYVAFCHLLRAPQLPSLSSPRFYTFGRNSTYIFRFNRQFLVTKHTSHGTFFSVLYYVALCHPPSLSQGSSASQLVSQVPSLSPPPSPPNTFGRNSTHIFTFNRQFLVTKHTSHSTVFSVLYYVAFCHLLKAPPSPPVLVSISAWLPGPRLPLLHAPALLVETQHVFSDLIGNS